MYKTRRIRFSDNKLVIMPIIPAINAPAAAIAASYGTSLNSSDPLSTSGFIVSDLKIWRKSSVTANSSCNNGIPSGTRSEGHDRVMVSRLISWCIFIISSDLCPSEKLKMEKSVKNMGALFLGALASRAVSEHFEEIN